MHFANSAVHEVCKLHNPVKQGYEGTQVVSEEEARASAGQRHYLGLEMIREIRHTCFMASSNNTRSITAFVSLYSFRACKAQQGLVV